MIAFVIPNETSKRQLPSFSLSVDSVEKLTGYDFFSNLDDSSHSGVMSFPSLALSDDLKDMLRHVEQNYGDRTAYILQEKEGKRED